MDLTLAPIAPPTRPLSLDERQAQVAGFDSGALVVFGGPGTGKTRTLEERFIRLSLQDACSPDRILFLVSNRAQKIELQDRLTRRLLFDEGLEAVVEVPVYTWHGLAHHLVSRHYDRLAYDELPVLLTSPEQWGDIKDALAAESEADWPHHKDLLRNRGFVDEVVDFCIRAEQRLLDERELSHLEEARPEWAEVIRFFRTHRERLRSRARVDYPTLLADAAWLIAEHEDVRESLHHRFLHILVDDAQELPLVQQSFLRFLSGGTEMQSHRSLVVAADPDSAIETFRGAEPDWLNDFGKEFGHHEVVVLATSYRLGPDAGRMQSAFISNNGASEHRAELFVGSSQLEARRFPNLAAELEAVGRELRLAHLRDQVPYEQMAILLTSPRSMLPTLERVLAALDVPFSLSAPDRPLDREPVVSTLTDLARYAYSDDLDPEDLTALLRSPLVGMEDADVRELERRARSAGVELIEYIGSLPDNTQPRVADRVATLFELRDRLREKKNRPADEAFWAIWEAAAYYRELEARSRANLQDVANRELDALVAFARALGRFVERRGGNGTLANYLEAIGRADFGADPWLPPERNRGGVQVLSFHAAKGKEWSLVAVCGCVEGAIPKGRRAKGLFDPYLLDEASAVQRARKNEAEDRRVFYVATTRASRRCMITTSPGPSRKGQPSRFIEELVGEPPAVERRDHAIPLTLSEAATTHRRVLADSTMGAPERVAALIAVARASEMDPTCNAAKPSEWWWRWGWSAGDISIRAQQHYEDLPQDKLQTSYSRIGVYKDCGLKYLLGTVLGLDPDTSHNMAFGTWIHKVFEECETGRITNQEAALARYHGLFDESVFPNLAIARQFRRDGEIMIDRYVNQLEPGKAKLVEVDFEIDLQGHRLTGRIDRVDAKGPNLIVSDYKTSRYAISNKDAAESLQLAIYYLAARTDPRISELGKPVDARLVYPGKLGWGGKVAVRRQTPEDADKAIANLPALIEGVLREDFRPRADADCTFCKFKPLCPLWNEGKELSE